MADGEESRHTGKSNRVIKHRPSADKKCRNTTELLPHLHKFLHHLQNVTAMSAPETLRTRNYLPPSAGPLRFSTAAHRVTPPERNFALLNYTVNSNFCIPHMLVEVCTNCIAHNIVPNPNTFLKTIFA